MSPMLRPRSHSLPSGFGRMLVEKFGRGRFLLVGGDQDELERQFSAAGAEIAWSESATGLPNGAEAELGIWFYPRENAADEASARAMAAAAKSVLLIPESGAEPSVRRPELVRQFGELGLLPDYDCDVGVLGPAALRLTRTAPSSAQALVPAVESAVARLQRHVRDLERSLGTRMSELEAADRHISKLEEKLLKLKEARVQLKQLKAEKQELRKSPERKLGQVLLAPYLLPKKLVRGIRKRMPKSPTAGRGEGSAGEYQRWFEKHRSHDSDLANFREE